MVNFWFVISFLFLAVLADDAKCSDHKDFFPDDDNENLEDGQAEERELFRFLNFFFFFNIFFPLWSFYRRGSFKKL